MRLTAIALSILMMFGQVFATVNNVKPNTTLQAETSNNTSAADSFAGQPNGNVKVGNVSKVSIHTLLPAGPNVFIYAHMLQWWGNNGHVSIGYSSLDPTQSTRDVNDILSRGFDGIWVNWYGIGSYEDKGLQLLKPEIEKHPGLRLLISIDTGALRWHSPCLTAKTCTVEQAITKQIAYLRTTYFPSPNYTRNNGRPIIAEFGMSEWSPNWATVQTANPDVLIMHRNSGAFTVPATGGGYSWLATQTTNYDNYQSLPYLNNFYAVSANNPTKLSVGSVFKGFNDIIASWSPAGGRHVAALCGKTWLDSWSLANQNIKSLRDILQVVTWDDYEEGTEIQTGIDNCLSLASTSSGTQVNWTVVGNEATLDHYTVFVSSDGQNLQTITDVPVGVGTYDVSQLQLAPGNYTVFVKAVGKPSIVNHMSNGSVITIQNQPPTASLAVVPSSGDMPLTVTATIQAADADGVVASSSIDFGDGVVMNGTSVQHTYLSGGIYIVTGSVTDNLGAVVTATSKVNVIVPSIVTMSSPLAGLSVLSPFRVIASATAPAGIKTMQVYIDGVKRYQVSASNLNVSLTASRGIRRIRIAAVDNNGITIYNNPVYFTIK